MNKPFLTLGITFFFADVICTMLLKFGAISAPNFMRGHTHDFMFPIFILFLGCGYRNQPADWTQAIRWLLTLFFLETVQLIFPVLGTFDFWDYVAYTAGMAVALPSGLLLNKWFFPKQEDACPTNTSSSN